MENKYEKLAKEWLVKEEAKYPDVPEWNRWARYTVEEFARFLDSEKAQEAKPQEKKECCEKCRQECVKKDADGNGCCDEGYYCKMQGDCPCHSPAKPTYALTPFTQETVDAMKKLNEAPAKPTEKRKEWDNEVEEALRHGRRYDDVGKIMKDLEAPVKRIEPLEMPKHWIWTDTFEGMEMSLMHRIWDKVNEMCNALNEKH